MSTNEYSMAFAEVLDILQHSEIEVIKKIPLNVISNIKEKSAKDYIPKAKDDIDFTISEKAKAILAVIYQDYLCEEEEAEDFIQQLIENEKKYQKEAREKYNTNDIFKKEGQNTNASDNIKLSVYKESIFKKMINKIKMWLK